MFGCSEIDASESKVYSPLLALSVSDSYIDCTRLDAFKPEGAFVFSAVGFHPGCASTLIVERPKVCTSRWFPF